MRDLIKGIKLIIKVIGSAVSAAGMVILVNFIRSLIPKWLNGIFLISVALLLVILGIIISSSIKE